MRLKPELRLALAQTGYVLVNCPDAMYEPEVHAGPLQLKLQSNR